MTAPRLLLWCLAGASLVQLALWQFGAGNPFGFSPIFWYLLTAYDAHGNLVLALAAGLAFFLRDRPEMLAIVRFAAERPWTLAAIAFALLCVGSLRVYHDYPLSMDEYAAAFQAKAFAAGRLHGSYPPELLDSLIPTFFQDFFLRVSPSSGAVASTYWPGFALLLAPFSWLGIPWAVNPAIGALTLPAVHRLARQITGSQEAGGWAALLTAASPAFVVASISYYSMPAHLLCNLLYALLLLRPTMPRALLAGALGSVALTLHQPVPHLLFCLPFLVWLAIRGGSAGILLALALGYLPLALLLGVGWHLHLAELAQVAPAASGAKAVQTAPAPSVLDSAVRLLGAALSLPHWGTVAARVAGLAKTWAWACAGLIVLAASGYAIARARTDVRLLAAALVATFVGYFFFSQDQGHGWGYRYIHSAWFVMPLLASVLLAEAHLDDGSKLRSMAAWCIVLSLVAANALRLTQVESFIDRHLAQVPPLARRADRTDAELIFVDIKSGFYMQDMVQNDPFLRGSRTVMIRSSPERDAQIAAKHFPGYVKAVEGKWGSLWRPGR